METVLRKQSFLTLDDMYAAVGYGAVPATKMVARLKDEYIRSLPEEERFNLGYRVTSGGQVIYSPLPTGISEENMILSSKSLPKSKTVRKNRKLNETGVIVKGIENCLVHLSRCCSPVPGDSIIGYVTRGNGVGVHRTNCSNIKNILKNSQDKTKDTEKASRLIDVYWEHRGEEDSYQVEICITANDRRHLLADISNAISDEKVSIMTAQLQAIKDFTANFTMTIEVKSQSQYDRVIGRIKAIRDVIEVRRGH